ncbi:MAG: TIGR03546 family protein, partial [Candidatus Bipolaricaulia bacterium]
MLKFWTWPRRLFRILNSELTPHQIAAGVLFGMFVGLVPLGANPVVLLALALLVRCSFSATLLALAVFKLLAWPLAPVSEAVGRAVLTNLTGLDPFWRSIVHAPVLAWMELSRYVVLGGYLIGLVIAVPVFFLVRRSVHSYRTSFLAFLEERRSIRALEGRERLARALQWLIMGGGLRFRDAPPKRGWAR